MEAFFLIYIYHIIIFLEDFWFYISTRITGGESSIKNERGKKKRDKGETLVQEVGDKKVARCVDEKVKKSKV